MSRFKSIVALEENREVRACAAWLAGELRLEVQGPSAPGAGSLLVVGATRAEEAMRRSPAALVLLPPRYREALPWRSMLVAASGERAADEALAAAVELAEELSLPVIVAHCEEEGGGKPALGAYADSPHHEFAGRLEEMVGRGLVSCAGREQRWVQEVLLCRGDPAATLLDLVDKREPGVLALGWHGELGEGRALVLKRLVESASCALLLVHKAERPTARLKIGPA